MQILSALAHFICTAAGNLIALLVSSEMETCIVNTALDRGVIEIVYRLCIAHARKYVLQASMWHLTEQITSVPIGSLYIINQCDMNMVGLACTTYHHICSCLYDGSSSAVEAKISILSSIHLCLSNLIVHSGATIAAELKNNGLFQHMLELVLSIVTTTPCIECSLCSVVWSSLHVLQNAMVSSTESDPTLAEWLCVEHRGWDAMLCAMEKYQDNPRIQKLACEGLRAALITGESGVSGESGGLVFPSTLSLLQLNRGRTALTVLLVRLLGNDASQVENGSRTNNIEDIQSQAITDLVETVLLCLVQIKTFLSTEDVDHCLLQLGSLTNFVALTTMHGRIQLLWHAMREQRQVHAGDVHVEAEDAGVVSSCVVG